MKKIILMGLSMLSINCMEVSAQSTTSTNTQVVGQPRYLGYSNNFDVRLRSNNTNRMIVENGNTGTNSGQIAIGNNLPNGFNPVDRLHLHQTKGGNFTRYTNSSTQSTSSDGFKIGITNNGTAMIRQYENRMMQFYTTNQHRMMIDNGGFGNNAGQIG